MEYASTGTWSSGTSGTSGTSTSRSSPRSTFPGSTSRSDPATGPNPLEQSKLNFEQAMADFQTMFPDMDQEVIEETLRANHGAVETTIDQLLLMSSNLQTVDVGNDKKLKSSSFNLHQQKSSTRWRPPLLAPLPDDFLRVVSPHNVRMDSHTREPRQSNLANIGQVIDPKRSLSGSSVKPGKSSSKNKISTLSSSPESSYMNEDNVNSYLQNEEFLRELQQDEEFMNALQKDFKLRTGRDNGAFLSNPDTLSSNPLPSSSQPAATDDSGDFENKVKKNMGLLSKQRLNLFAKQFSRGKKKPSKNILNKSTPSSYDHLIEDSNSLVSDDDDHVAEGSAHVRLDK